jgi:heterotetrameric sarcosine oxidase delta subunit
LAFLLRCPNCGERSAYDFRFGGEALTRPSLDASSQDWVHYFYFRKNEAGVQREWWYHRLGCRKWFLAERDTRNNTVLRTYWP